MVRLIQLIRRVSFSIWWQALVLIWAVIAIIEVPFMWMGAALFLRTPIMYQLAADATLGWIEFGGALLIFILFIKGLSSLARGLRKLK
jgi:hypothetical protein